MTRWALEDAPNQTVVRLHVDGSLTDETIVTCPPNIAPEPLDRLLEIEAIRSIDLHRHRARVNLHPDADRDEAGRHVSEVLEPVWGPPAILTPDPGPRALEAATDDRRTVAESPAMARGHRVLEAIFGIEGVVEAIAGEGLVLVRLGRLFAWDDLEAQVQSVIEGAGGMPGSTSGSS